MSFAIKRAVAMIWTGAGREFICWANVSVRAYVIPGHGVFITRGKSWIRQLKAAGAFVIQIATMLQVFAKIVICYESKAHNYGVYLVLVYKLYGGGGYEIFDVTD